MNIAPDLAFRLGCAVWAYKDWLGSFYPQGSRPGEFLQLYGQRLTTVEGNTTFYSIPDAETVQRWAAAVPPTFRFCPKLPRRVTHDRLLLPHLDEALAFVALMRGLGERLGPLFAQLPPSYGPTQFADLAAFLDRWPHHEAPLAVEVRHLDWFQPEWATRLNALLRQQKTGRVLLDTRLMYAAGVDDPQAQSDRRKPNVPLQPVTTAEFALVRYIGHPQPEKNTAALAGWAEQVKIWLSQGVQVYFFVHCPNEAVSPAIARQFHRALATAGSLVPPLPWDKLAAPPKQLPLF